MNELAPFLRNGGEMGSRLRAHDWSSSPLGHPDTWPQSLRSVVGLMLGSKFPMFLAWGPELGFLYNDAYAEILGAKHPDALGRPFQAVWSEIWSDILPFIETALGGQATWLENLPLVMHRRGYDEETFFTFSYSPAFDDDGQVLGMFCACTETTAQVQSERRQSFRLALEERLRDVADPDAVLNAAVVMLGEHLRVERVGYAQVQPDDATVRLSHCYAKGVEPLDGIHPLDSFGPERIERQRQGETEVSNDVLAERELGRDAATWKAIDTRAVVSVPLVRDGRLRATLYVNAREPRRWSAAEVALIEDVAIRTWAAVERARAEADLRESEDNYRNTVELNPQTTWTAQPDGQLDRVAERWREWTGGSGLGSSWGEAMHPDDLDRSVEAWLRSVATGEPYDIEHRAKMVSGRYHWMHSRAYPRRDAQGRITKWYGSTEDIDERKVAEEALRESEGRFRGFAQAVPNQLWTARPDGRPEWFNERVSAYSGIEAPTLVGPGGWRGLVHPGDLPGALEAWTRSLGSGEIYETEFRIRRSDGAYRWFLIRAVPTRAPDGEIMRWVGANTDIEDRKRQTIELAHLNETLEMRVAERTADRDRMWRLSTDLMLVAQLDAAITAVNPAWTGLLGWAEEDLVGRSFMDMVHPDDVTPTLEAVGDLSDGRRILRFENRYRGRDGRHHWISWTAVPDSGLIHAVGRDISAEKLAEEELGRAQEALRQSQKMEAVGQLTGGLAHDFNNLLAGISGSLELMQARMEQGRVAEVGKYLVGAQGAAKRAAALTHRLLAFSRRQTLDPKPTDVNRLVQSMEELLTRTVGPAIRVETVASAGLWSTLVDPNQLENALLNLCINARDAMPDGGVLTIETGNRWLDERAGRERDLPPGQYVSLCVSDNGTGMSPDIVERAFDPFFTTKPIGVGTGLGLSMIYGFARQSGGQVRIYSEVGEGTMVCLYLPRHHAAVEPEADAAPSEAPRAEAGETVLVIDDEPLVRMLIVDVLEELGYTALEAGDGPEGLAILRTDVRLDLLITDVGLPNGMNGRQVADAARQLRPDLRVLFVTGYAENAVLSHGHLDPGMQVVTKPFDMTHLAQRIRSMVES